MKVAGRKNRVTDVMIFMDVASCLVLFAVSSLALTLRYWRVSLSWCGVSAKLQKCHSVTIIPA